MICRLFLAAVALPLIAASPSDWTLYITADTCSDYTWGFDEAATRRAYAETIRAHLDQMSLTDREAPEDRDRYNLSITQEFDAFLEHYPERRDELARRVKEGRIFIGPVYNNALWSFQSTEGMIRTLYPARRLEKEYGIRIDVAEHIEQPSLPWGAASVLAAAGIHWLSVPYYDFDSTFSKLTNPPLFTWEGPDGGRIRVVMDRFASAKQGYWQGQWLLEKPERILADWLPNYQQTDYPVRSILASGTHQDAAPDKWKLTAPTSEAIIRYNAQPGPHPKLVNATLPMFFSAVDAAKPNLPLLRGTFGDSWDLWPVTLAKYAAGARTGERRLLAAEALFAAAGAEPPRVEWRKAEWNWMMLADHAWNGTDDANRKVNADLRQRWSEELRQQSEALLAKAWRAAGIKPAVQSITLFNGLSFPRSGLVRIEVPDSVAGVAWQGKPLASQLANEDGRLVLYFLSPEIPAYSFATLSAIPQPRPLPSRDRKGADSLPSAPETVYFDGAEHRLANITTEVESSGPLFTRWKTHGSTEGMDVTTYVTTYPALDRSDFDVRVHKPAGNKEEHVTTTFPVAAGSVIRLEAMGAVIRPLPQPEGDLLPGADPRRFAVQDFVDAANPNGGGVTIVPIEAFFLRKDLPGIAFEVLANDQNYKEVSHDQGGVTDFRFRYSQRTYKGAYDNAATLAWSRSIANPVVATFGAIEVKRNALSIDPSRAIALTYKPAEDGGRLLRVWETAGRSGRLTVAVPGYREAYITDLLERPLHPLPIHNGSVDLDLRGNGFAAVRLIP